mmetsp:Transcript_99387/g.277722  ORF Transcript_99387/g.277722 Transcript_99387/m.277722 type:complete len:202 (-) Transcript_99387:415-1020(-)
MNMSCPGRKRTVASSPIPHRGPTGHSSPSTHLRIRRGGSGYRRRASDRQARRNGSFSMSPCVIRRQPRTSAISFCTASRALEFSSLISSFMVQVSKAAVVSWPSMSSVIRSSRSCRCVTTSSLRVWTKNCIMDMSPFAASVPLPASSVALLTSSSSMAFSKVRFSLWLFWSLNRAAAPGKFQYGNTDCARLLDSRSTDEAA